MTNDKDIERLWAHTFSKSGYGPEIEKQLFDGIDGPCPVVWRRNLTFPLYRYTKQIYVDEFFNKGKIRLTPVLEYRDVEKFSAAIGDAQEGQINFHSRTINPECPTCWQCVAQNQWTICTSEVRSDERMMAEFGVDSVFQINSIDFFLRLNDEMTIYSSSCLIDRVAYVDNHAWSIDVDKLEPGFAEFAGLYKRQKHAYQREVRPVWEPRKGVRTGTLGGLSDDRREEELKAAIAYEKGRISYLDLEASSAVQYCTRL